MDITGARWSVDGAEAVLKLRAVRANDDFDGALSGGGTFAYCSG